MYGSLVARQINICINESDRKAVFKMYQNNRRNQMNICPKSCLFTNLYFGPPVTGLNNAEEKHVGKMIFYFKQEIKTTREYVLYSWRSMVAEVGGYMGLLLGISIFQLTNINNIFLNWLAKTWLTANTVRPKNLEYENGHQITNDKHNIAVHHI